MGSLFVLHGVLKRKQKIYKSSCLKESNQLWPFLSLRMNYFHPVSFIYLWSWEFSCDRRSLWHGAKTGPALGNYLFLCVCWQKWEALRRQVRIPKHTTDSCGNLKICVTGELVGTPHYKMATFGKYPEVGWLCQSPGIAWCWESQWNALWTPLMRFCTVITGRLMVNLAHCIPQEFCDLVVRWRSQNCWNQSTWFISDEAKATPWFP